MAAAVKYPTVRGRLYKPVPDDTPATVQIEEMRISEMKSRVHELVGRPLYYDHQYKQGAIGQVLNAWIAKDGWVWTEARLFSDDFLGPDYRNGLKDKSIKDFSIAYKFERLPHSGAIAHGTHSFPEISITPEGANPGTHIVKVEASTSLDRHVEKTGYIYKQGPPATMSLLDIIMETSEQPPATSMDEEPPAERPSSPDTVMKEQMKTIEKLLNDKKALEEKNTILNKASEDLEKMRAEQRAGWLEEQKPYAKTLLKIAEDFEMNEDKMVTNSINTLATQPEGGGFWDYVKKLGNGYMEKTQQATELNEKIRAMETDVIADQAQAVTVAASKRMRNSDNDIEDEIEVPSSTPQSRFSGLEHILPFLDKTAVDKRFARQPYIIKPPVTIEEGECSTTRPVRVNASKRALVEVHSSTPMPAINFGKSMMETIPDARPTCMEEQSMYRRLLANQGQSISR